MTMNQTVIWVRLWMLRLLTGNPSSRFIKPITDLLPVHTLVFIHFPLSCQILYPLVFFKMYECPRYLSNLIHAGARIYHNHRPVQKICACNCKRYCYAPHRHSKRVHIKHRISSRTKDTVYDDFIYRSSNHVEGKYTE